MDTSFAGAPATGKPGRDRQAPETTPVLDIQELTIGFGSRRILAEITLQVPARGVSVLMGPSGTGKSTLLHWLSGQEASRRFSRGSVLYLGQPIGQADRRPALVRQQAQFFRGRLADILADGLRDRMHATPGDLRHTVTTRMQELGAERMLPSLDTIVSDLPASQMRAAALLRGALTDSPLLLIDEPTLGLDEPSAARILALIERIGQERACLVSTHNQRHARQIATQAVLLAGGRTQIACEAAAFFSNRDQHPILGQFLRTGSCSVPGPDAQAEALTDDATQSPLGTFLFPAPSAASPAPPTAPPPAPATPPAAPSAPAPDTASTSVPAAAPRPAADDHAEDQAPIAGAFPPIADAPPSSMGPTGFHWLIKGRIAGCAKPGVVNPVDHDLGLLKKIGVTLLINLTEHDFPPEALARHGLKGYALKIQDRHAPPLLWAKLLLAKMERFLRDGEVIAVHCLAGLGRTGTVLGAWLIREGLTAEEALRRLRRINPGYVQSEVQEALLAELEHNLLIRAN